MAAYGGEGNLSSLIFLAWKGLGVVICFSSKKITICNGSTTFEQQENIETVVKKAASFEVLTKDG